MGLHILGPKKLKKFGRKVDKKFIFGSEIEHGSYQLWNDKYNAVAYDRRTNICVPSVIDGVNASGYFKGKKICLSDNFNGIQLEI